VGEGGYREGKEELLGIRLTLPGREGSHVLISIDMHLGRLTMFSCYHGVGSADTITGGICRRASLGSQ